MLRTLTECVACSEQVPGWTWPGRRHRHHLWGPLHSYSWVKCMYYFDKNKPLKT